MGSPRCVEFCFADVRVCVLKTLLGIPNAIGVVLGCFLPPMVYFHLHDIRDETMKWTWTISALHCACRRIACGATCALIFSHLRRKETDVGDDDGGGLHAPSVLA